MLAQGLVVMPDGSRPVVPLTDDGSSARPVAAAVQAAPTTAAALELVAGARARAAHLDMMRTPSGVPSPVQPSNTAGDWSDIIAKVEAEQPRNAMTSKTRSDLQADDHGWAAVIAKLESERTPPSPA